MAKNTNYQKLWRKAKERETAMHNFVNAMIEAIPKNFKDKKEVEAFMTYVTYIRSGVSR